MRVFPSHYRLISHLQYPLVYEWRLPPSLPIHAFWDIIDESLNHRASDGPLMSWM